MNQTRMSRLCRWADRRGLLAERPEGKQRGAGGSGFAERFLRSHVNRCPLCRAEVARWSEIERALRRTARVQAPPELLKGALARIAVESADRVPRPQPGPRTVWGPWERAAWISVFALLLGWIGFLAAFDQQTGFVRWALDAMAYGGGLVETAFQSFQAYGTMVWSALPQGIGTALTVLIWTGVGIGIADLVSRLVGGRPIWNA